MCSYIREHLKKNVRKKSRDMFIISSLRYKARTFAPHCNSIQSLEKRTILLFLRIPLNSESVKTMREV